MVFLNSDSLMAYDKEVDVHLRRSLQGRSAQHISGRLFWPLSGCQAPNELSCRYFAHVNSAEPTGCCHLVAGRMNRLVSGGNSTERNEANGGTTEKGEKWKHDVGNDPLTCRVTSCFDVFFLLLSLFH